MLRSACALLALVILSSTVSAQQEPTVPDGVAYEKDIVYGTGGGEPLHLDIAYPKENKEPRACVVFIHGGGWRGGNFKGHVPQILQFAQQGFVSATVQYRLVPKASFPAQIEDVKCAVRFLRANSDKYHLDPKRIGAVGFSAGAHLSMLLGTMDKADGLEGDGGHADQSSKVQAVVAFFGPTDLTQPDFPEAVGKMITDFTGDYPEGTKKASPITYVDAQDAPLLIYHGTKDQLVPWNQAVMMSDALTKVGVPGRVELMLGAAHGWGEPEITRTLAGTLQFFKQELKQP